MNTLQIFPHPKRGFQGFDPGRPDHVAALATTKVGSKLIVHMPDGFVAARCNSWREVNRYLDRAAVSVAECQADRARDHAARLEAVRAYLAARAERDSAKQMNLF